MTTSSESPDVTTEVHLDAIHSAALDVAMDLDRDYQRRHPDLPGYIRPAIAHELCPAYDGGCVIVEHIAVAFLEPGSRVRAPYGGARWDR